MTEPLAPTSPTSDQGTGLQASVAALLGRFGVATVSTHDEIIELVTTHLNERAITASIKSLRYQELILEATATNAALLRYETDALKSLVNAHHPGALDLVRIHVVRA